MFSIFSRKYPAIDFSTIGTDMHSHLLPGIDDGAPDNSASAILKKGLEELGFNQFIATPHIMWDMYRNTPETINSALNGLQNNNPLHNNIRAAAEYYMDDHFDKLVAEDQPLLAIKDKMILLEFSFISPPVDLKEKLFALQIKGFQPLMAHPERYEYLSANKSFFDQLKDMGCLFQMNLLSVTGYYGKIPRILANYLIEKNYIDFVGTDLHHLRHLEEMRSNKKIMPALEKLLGSGKLLNHTLAF